MTEGAGWMGRAGDVLGLESHSRAKHFGDGDGFPLETGVNDRGGFREGLPLTSPRRLHPTVVILGLKGVCGNDKRRLLRDRRESLFLPDFA